MIHRTDARTDGDSVVRCLQPISEESACGADARLAAEYELLRGEIAKLSAVDGALPDWAIIESMGCALLADKSKDLLVAVYVACALAVRDGMAGATRGASLLTTLLTAFGSGLFPRRTRARVAALEWYLEWLGARLDSVAPTSSAPSAHLREQLHQLRTAAQRLLGDEAPPFEALLRRCDRIGQVADGVQERGPAEAALASHPRPAQALVPAIIPQRSAPVAQPAQSVARPESSAADGTPPVSGPVPCTLAGLQTYVARAGSSWVDLARSRFEVDRTDARAYRWLRAGVWLRWEEAPLPNRRGRTQLDGPSPARHAELIKATQGGQWDELLSLSELLLVKYPLWLDLNRCSALALEQLGESFAAAGAHVLRETRALVARMPELSTLAFADGAPFASADTVAWLSPPVAPLTSPLQTTTLDATLRERLCKRDSAAVSELERRLCASHSARTSFLLRLELADTLECNGEPQRAALVYLGLERDVDTYRLERWEPELALRVVHPLWKIVSARAGHPPVEVSRLAARLSQLSPTLLL
jgi:type VI secretion system protein VasJ